MLFDQAGFDSVHNQTCHGLGTRLGFEFITDRFHGPGAEVHDIGDLLGAFFFAHQFEDRDFLVGQLYILGHGGFHGPFGTQPAEEGLIGQVVEIEILLVDAADGFVDHFRTRFLGQVGVGADFHHPGNNGVVIVHGEHDHLYIGVKFLDLREGSQAIHDGHLDIQQNDVGLNVFQEIEELHAVLGFGYHLNVFSAGKRGFHSGTEQRVVVSNSNFDN